jgi:hypothetical protein
MDQSAIPELESTSVEQNRTNVNALGPVSRANHSRCSLRELNVFVSSQASVQRQPNRL